MISAAAAAGISPSFAWALRERRLDVEHPLQPRPVAEHRPHRLGREQIAVDRRIDRADRHPALCLRRSCNRDPARAYNRTGRARASISSNLRQGRPCRPLPVLAGGVEIADVGRGSSVRGGEDERGQPENRAGVAAEGSADARELPSRGGAAARARRRRDPLPHDLPLARPLHARPHERGAVLREAGRDRRGHGRRHGRAGRPLAARGLRRGRPRGRPRRLAELRDFRGRRSGKNRSGAGADLDRARRARHARPDRLRRPARDRQAPGRRDPGRGRGLRPGRLGGRPDREDQGLPRGRDRGLEEQMRVRRRASSASMPASTIMPATSPISCAPPARTASTSTGRTSAGGCSRRSFRSSTTSRACRSAA